MQAGVFEVRAEWDDEARVWTVTESTVPGLAAEAESVETLQEKLKTLIPELVKENAHHLDWEPGRDLPYHLLAERRDRIYIA